MTTQLEIDVLPSSRHRELADHDALRSPVENAVGISVVIPISERPEGLAELHREYAAALRQLDQPFEFIYATEPWRREYALQVASQAREDEPVLIVEAAQTVGEASLLKLAVERSAGRIIVTSPAYFRIVPASLINLIRRVEDGADLVVARRWPRRDSWINRIQTRLFHNVLGRIAGGRLNDVACGVRAMRRQVLEELPLYGDFFRFLPVLAIREGYRVEEVSCPQDERDSRTRVYRPGVYLRRLIDLLNLFFLLRFTFKPLRFFGLMGSGLGLTGALLLAVLFAQRITMNSSIASRPMLLLGVLLLTLGLQMFALGLVGEIIVHLQAPNRRNYRIVREETRTESDSE